MNAPDGCLLCPASVSKPLELLWMFVLSLLHAVYILPLLFKIYYKDFMFVASASAQISISLASILRWGHIISLAVGLKKSFLSSSGLKFEVPQSHVCAVCFSPKWMTLLVNGRLLPLFNSKDYEGIFFCYIFFLQNPLEQSDVYLSLLRHLYEHRCPKSGWQRACLFSVSA